MTDRERESKFQQKEGEQRKAGQETREEMKEEAQEKGQKEIGSFLKRLRWRKENFLVLLLLGILLLVAAWPVEKKSRSTGTETKSSMTDSALSFLDYGESTNMEDTRETYVVSLEHSLEELLSTMEGVGEKETTASGNDGDCSYDSDYCCGKSGILYGAECKTDGGTYYVVGNRTWWRSRFSGGRTFYAGVEYIFWSGSMDTMADVCDGVIGLACRTGILPQTVI